MARYLARRPDLDDVALIRCNMAFGGPERNAQMARLISRYGFELAPAATAVTLAERARHRGENILISLMVLARNASALRQDTLRCDRTPGLSVAAGARTALRADGIDQARSPAGQAAHEGLG
jgi:hypothetical protein